MNKKGFSPITLTVLLIIFALSFGILIKYIIPIPTDVFSSCSSDVNIKLVQISKEELLCSDGSSLQFTIENGVTTEIASLIILINDQPQEVLTTIGKAETYVGKIATIEKINSIEIIPKIILNDEQIICESKSIKRKEIKQC
jgi:hypothetical protein